VGPAGSSRQATYPTGISESSVWATKMNPLSSASQARY
jgi:hypothetical protein